MSDSTFLRRVRIKNYKSIGGCDLALGPLTFLVGPNGAGKSNFLDALRFVADALNTSVNHALRERGGINEVRRRSAGHPTHFGIRLEFRLPSGVEGHYAFRIGAKSRGAFEVQHEDASYASPRPWPSRPSTRSKRERRSRTLIPPSRPAVTASTWWWPARYGSSGPFSMRCRTWASTT